ncbi:aspartate--tRNA ligase dps1 [Sporothrix curviconia]|uniref:Aspartate--tRNA ligase dps1 n=1 Tax=Sporothrix curviconia TaxID=1260050 RepID=A0ABP0BJ00_9PEZI
MSPNGLKQPLLKLNQVIGHSAAKNHISRLKLGDVEALEDPKNFKDAEKAKQGLILGRTSSKKRTRSGSVPSSASCLLCRRALNPRL